MKRYFLDTNTFFNMEAGLNLGTTTKEVADNLVRAVRSGSQSGEFELYMPPRIIEEFLSFFNDQKELFVQDLLSVVIVQSPDFSKIDLSASIFARLIEDVRNRSLRGMQIAEEEMENAVFKLSSINTSQLSKKDFQIAIGGHIRAFRDRYRNATRHGFIDSLADLDLILLAKELDGYLVSTDEGVLNWGRLMGVKEVPLSSLRLRLGV